MDKLVVCCSNTNDVDVFFFWIHLLIGQKLDLVDGNPSPASLETSSKWKRDRVCIRSSSRRNMRSPPPCTSIPASRWRDWIFDLHQFRWNDPSSLIDNGQNTQGKEYKRADNQSMDSGSFNLLDSRPWGFSGPLRQKHHRWNGDFWQTKRPIEVFRTTRFFQPNDIPSKHFEATYIALWIAQDYFLLR